MSEHDALLAAILADPAADLPRLVYADWIEQYQHQAERAEFIRVQCKIADLGERQHTNQFAFCKTRQRIFRLHSHCRKLFGFGPGGAGRKFTDWPGYRWAGYATNLLDRQSAESLYQSFQRGFVAEVSAPLDVLMGGECNKCEGDGVSMIADYHRWKSCKTCHGTGRIPVILPRLVREQPVEFVRVTNRQPMHDEGAGVWMWFGGGGVVSDGRRLHPQSDIPREIAALIRQEYGKELVMFPSRKAAEKAMSDALLEWAKQQVIQ